MKNKFFKSVEIKIAVFAIVGLFLLVWGINFLKGIDIFKKQYSYYVVFENASGLLPSHLVTVNGLSIGIVDNIQLMPQNSNKILVTINIDKNVEIPVNSIARVASSNPLSSPQIEILFGNETRCYQEGDTIRAEIAAGLLDGLSSLGGIVANIDTIITVAKQKIVLSGAIDSFKMAMEDFHSITQNIDNILKQNSPKINNVMSDLQSFTAMLHENNKKIDQIIGKLNKVSSDLAEAELKKTIDNAKDAIENVNNLIHKVNQGEGTLGQLVVNDSLYSNLNNSLTNLSSSLVSLDKLLIDIQKNPKKYINITVFEKKKKGE
jgi:phospholipid/cholesterol/gamma-HCH transport system substrate-binding protein